MSMVSVSTNGSVLKVIGLYVVVVGSSSGALGLLMICSDGWRVSAISACVEVEVSCLQLCVRRVAHKRDQEMTDFIFIIQKKTIAIKKLYYSDLNVWCQYLFLFSQ